MNPKKSVKGKGTKIFLTAKHLITLLLICDEQKAYSSILYK